MKKNKAVAIRVDAGGEIGVGHFMRCLTLANRLKERGAHIRFISRFLPEYLIDMLLAKQFEYVPVGKYGIKGLLDELFHAQWLGTSQIHDADATIQALKDKFWDWLIVDHYALDFRWESELRPTVGAILTIDDLADRRHDCDILLDQNYFYEARKRYDNKLPDYCQRLLGPHYALLRREFKILRDNVKVRTGVVKNALVFFGGIDVYNYTMLALEVLVDINIEISINVVVGAQHPFKEEILRLCDKHGCICHVQTSCMEKLMAEADLAIGAGGTANWERCCLGLPALIIAVADNQTHISNSLNSIEACVYIGSGETVSKANIKKSLIDLISDPKKISRISKNAFALVDGDGANRVALEMGF